MDTPVSIDTYTDQVLPATQPVSIDVPQFGRPAQVNVSPEVARIRAFKAAYGIKDVNPHPEQEIYTKMISGYEDVMRNQVATELDQKKAETNAAFLSKVATVPNITPDQIKTALDSLDHSPYDANTVFEKAYAKAYVDNIDKAGEKQETNWVPNAKQTLPEAFKGIKAVGSDLITKQQALRRWAQDIVQNDVANQSWPGYLADMAKQMFQPYVEWKQRGNTPGVGFFQGPLGYNLRKQGEEVLRKPLNEMMESLKGPVEKLRADNPQLAAQYLMSLAGMTSEEEIVNNMFTFMMPLDIAGIVYGAKGIPKGPTKVETVDFVTGKTLSEKVTHAVKDVVRASGDEPHTPASMASAAGDIETAGTKLAAEKVDKLIKGEASDPKSEVEHLTSNFRFDKLDAAANPGTRGADFSNRVLQAYERNEPQVQKAVNDRVVIDKVPGVMDSEEALKVLSDRIRLQGEYAGLKSAVGDISFQHDRTSNTYSYNIHIRDHNGLPFDSPETAWGFARLNGLSTTKDSFKQIGANWEIVLNKPVKATDSIFRDLLVPTNNAEPNTFLRTWLGNIINPDENLAPSHRQARKIAAYGPQFLMKAAKEDARMIQGLSRGATSVNPITGKTETRKFAGMRERWNEWLRMVEAGRTMIDPNDRTKPPGYWYKSVGEIEEYYMQNYHRLPEEAEVAAYFAYKRINEYDRVMRDLRLVSNLRHRGVEQHTVHYTAKDGESKQISFMGTREDKVPRSGATLLFIRNNAEGESKRYKLGNLGNKVNEELEKGVSEGKIAIIRVDNPDNREFAWFGPINNEHWVNYVAVPAVDSHQVPFNILPRRGGGHWAVDAEFYLKQARVYADTPSKKKDGKNSLYIYGGDTTIMPISIRKMGVEIAGHLNEIRKLLKEGETEAAMVYHQAHPVGPSWEEVKAWFKSGKDANGNRTRALLSLDHDIRVVPKDKKIVDMDKTLEDSYLKNGQKFQDGTRTGNPAEQSKIEFTRPRDAEELWTVNDYGTANRPLYQYEPARMVDPIETMNRALTRITQSIYLEDYKQFAVEHWLQAAKPFLNESDKELYGAPYHYFYTPQWRDAVPEETKRNLMATNWNIRQFLGVSSPTDNLIKSQMQKMVDGIYGAFGPRAVKLVPEWMLHGMTDPINFVKQITYHTSLGLFSIPQLVVQMQTYALIAALSPRSAATGAYSALLHQWARVNPGMVDTLDKWATKLNLPGLHGLKPGEFKEAFELGHRTGFFDIQGEYAMVDDMMHGNRLVQNMGQQFLSWGTTPFKAGERHVRLGAWYTAYQEYRSVHPTGRITDKELGIILNRADDLTANMSRASSSSLHTGPLAITSQFLSYQLRIAELFLGSRTSYMDKARMFTFFAALYGVPSAVGLTGVPFGDYLRKKAIEEGYVVGDNWVTSLIGEGVPALLGAFATGGGDIKKGTFYNIGDRYGVGGMTFIRDVLRGDRSWATIIGGAAYSKLANTLEAFDPFWQAMMSGLRDDDQSFPIVPADFLQPLKEISSVNNAARFIGAINTGRWMSKKGIYLDDVSPLNAAFMAVSGLQPQRVTDLNAISWSIKDREEVEKWAEKQFKENYKKGLRIAGTQPEESKDYFKRAFVYLWVGGIRDDQLTKIISSAAQDNLSLVNEIDWSYYVKKAPKDKQNLMYEALGRKQTVQGN